MKSARLQAAEAEKAFCHGYGKPSCAVRIAFAPAVRQAGIQHVTLYNLHHTLTSRPAMAEVDLPAGQAFLGHEVSSEYSGWRRLHQSDDHMQAAVKSWEKTQQVAQHPALPPEAILRK